MTPIEKALQVELANWSDNELITNLIQKYYTYSHTVLVIWAQGRKLVMSVSWQYHLSNAMNNDCPNSKIGDVITEFIGKVDKTNPEGLKFLLEEDFDQV
jgi:hypothetical protein